MPQRLIICLLILSLAACSARKPVQPQIRVIYKKGCITSDIVCHKHPDREDSCNFDALQGCAIIEVEPPR